MTKLNLKKCYYLSIILGIGLMSCQKNSNQAKDNTQTTCLSKKEIKALNPLTVNDAEVNQEIRFNGHITYDPNNVLDYVSMVSGTIVKTYISLGDKVQKNQILAEINSAELNSLTSRLQQLESKLKVAKRELAAKESFNQDGLASSREVTAAKSEVETVKTEITTIRTNLTYFSTRSQNGSFQIKAPQSGFIVANKMTPGLSFSAESESLFTISDLDKVWVNLDVYAHDITFIKEGMPVIIKSSAYPDKVFKAKIDRVSSVIDPQKNVLQAWAVLENADLFLKPGLHVEIIAIAKNSKEKAPKIPTSAILFFNNQHYVVKLQACHTQNQKVEILYRNEKSAYIKTGLIAGEKIITKNTLIQFEHNASFLE